MVSRARALLGAFCVQVCFASGCLAQARIESRTVNVPTAQEQELIASLQEPSPDSVNAEDQRERLEKALATKQPVVIIAAMSAASNWVNYGPGGPDKRKERLATVEPSLGQCVASRDRFTRMAGVMALVVLQDSDRLQRELKKDSSFLLVRPENKSLDLGPTTPQDTPESLQKKMAVITAVAALTDTRNKLIEVCGRLRIREARRILEAIAADSQGETVAETAKLAREALNRIDGRDAYTESRGRKKYVSVPLSKIELRGTKAKVVATIIRGLTPEEKELRLALIKSERSNVRQEEITRLCEAAFNTRHPYLVKLALDTAVNWSSWGPVVPEEKRGRPNIANPLIDQCLSSKEPFERLAGLLALVSISEFDRVRQELAMDSSVLLYRPEPDPLEGQSAAPRVPRQYDSVFELAFDLSKARTTIIRMSGTLKVNSSRPNLEAILLDPEGKEDLSASDARDAIAMIDGLVPPDPLP